MNFRKNNRTHMGNLMTVEQVAEMLQLSTDKVYRMASSMELGSYKIGNVRRFSTAQVEEWLERNRIRSLGEMATAAKSYVKSHPLRVANRKAL